MSPTLVLSAIIFFIISLVGCLILTLSANKIDHPKIRPFYLVHFILLLTTLTSFLFHFKNEYLILSVFCSGLLLSGILLRKKYSVLIKTYFAIYLSLFFFFIYSPSLLAYFITGNYDKVKSPQTINLKENYYLAEQQSMLGLSSNYVTYKIYKKNGLYKKTILRDVDFGGKIDSVHVINFTEDTLIIKGFISNHDTTLYKKPGLFKKGDIRRIKINN